MDNFTFTAPYMNDDVTWCVQRSLGVPRWLLIFLTFQDYVALFMPLITFILLTVVLWVYSCVEGTDHDLISCIVICFGVTLALPIYYRPALMATKAGFAWLSLMAVVVSVIFLSVNTSYISVPLRYRQVHSVRDLIANEFALEGTHDTLSNLRNLNEA